MSEREGSNGAERVSVRAWSARLSEDEPSFDTIVSVERTGDNQLRVVADGREAWVEEDNFEIAMHDLLGVGAANGKQLPSTDFIAAVPGSTIVELEHIANAIRSGLVTGVNAEWGPAALRTLAAVKCALQDAEQSERPVDRIIREQGVKPLTVEGMKAMEIADDEPFEIESLVTATLRRVVSGENSTPPAASVASAPETIAAGTSARIPHSPATTAERLEQWADGGNVPRHLLGDVLNAIEHLRTVQADGGVSRERLGEAFAILANNRDRRDLGSGALLDQILAALNG